ASGPSSIVRKRGRGTCSIASTNAGMVVGQRLRCTTRPRSVIATSSQNWQCVSIAIKCRGFIGASLRQGHRCGLQHAHQCTRRPQGRPVFIYLHCFGTPLLRSLSKGELKQRRTEAVPHGGVTTRSELQVAVQDHSSLW